MQKLWNKIPLGIDWLTISIKTSLILFPRNIFTWNLVGCCKTPRETCFAIFRCFVCFDWLQFTLQRPKELKNNPKILGFAPFHPQKKKVHFFNYLCEVIVMTGIFIQKNFFQRVSFPLHGFLNKNHEFFGFARNGFSPEKRSQWRYRYAEHTSKMRCCLPHPRMSSLTP